MLSETEMRLIAGLIAAIETGILGQTLFVFIYEHANSNNQDTLRGFLNV
jgi:hypothetical protein